MTEKQKNTYPHANAYKDMCFFCLFKLTNFPKLNGVCNG